MSALCLCSWPSSDTCVQVLDSLSFPPPPLQAWSWGEHVLATGSLDRFTVDTIATEQGVLSALLIDPTHNADFAFNYNCTAWNRFGARSAVVSLRRQGKACSSCAYFTWSRMKMILLGTSSAPCHPLSCIGIGRSGFKFLLSFSTPFEKVSVLQCNHAAQLL